MQHENENEDNLDYQDEKNEENYEEQADNNGEEDSLNKKEQEIKIMDGNVELEKNPTEDKADEPNQDNQNSKINKENRKDNAIKLSMKKNKAHLAQQEEIRQKNDNNEKYSTEELFKKAIEKSSNKSFPLAEIDDDGNTVSTKITEVLYDKFVGKNIQKSKHLDIYSKIRDEEIRQGRERTRTKNDAQRINNMIVRQEDYEKLKSDKKKGRQREIKKKINEVCVWIPNGKKNSAQRNPNKFYDDQKKFVEQKKEIIHKMTQDALNKETQNANVSLVSKNSEKLANSKNPNETPAEFCKRLAEEKLKNQKKMIEAPKEERKLTKKEIVDLTEKLHKEGETFKNNRIKMGQEQIDKMKKLEKNDFVLLKSKKVLFDKFMSNYKKVMADLFDKTDNLQINFDEYKNVLTHLGFIRNNSPMNEKLVKESFNNYLKPTEEKIDTNSFLLFALAVLGIYKGNDEKIEEHSSKVSLIKPEEEKEDNANNEKIKENKNININSSIKKNQAKTSLELIKTNLPNFDFEKYGFSGKECKNIKNKFFSLISGISESWSKDLFKKKQERLDKMEETSKKNDLEETKKLENKLKKEEEFLIAYRKKLFPNNDESNEKDKEYNVNTTKSFKVEDMYEILQKKKQRELDNLKAKQEEDILQECTFQPNPKKPVDKKGISKTIEKLYLEGKESYMKKNQLTEKDLDINSENEKNCTFKPVIKDYKGEYFGNNPLKEDKLFNTEIKKMEKIREEKGYTNKEIKKQMAFGIEPKSIKEDIYKRVIPNRAEKIVGNVTNEFEDYSSFDDQGNQSLLKIEVKLENNKKSLLTIYPHDDYVKIVEAFCNKHGLKEEKRIRLIRVIKDKLRKNDS